MAKPRSAPTTQAFKVPEAPDLMPSYDPFTVAKQFDQLRSSFTGGGAAPFQMPTPAPPPQTFGGNLPSPAPVQAGPTAARPAPRPGMPATAPSAAAPSGPPGSWGSMDYGGKTATFQQQFPSLRHTSGYRDPEHNARTPGASPTSYHMQRDAAGNARANDYVGSAKDMAAAAAWAKQMGAKEVLIHNAGTGQHLHIAW